MESFILKYKYLSIYLISLFFFFTNLSLSQGFQGFLNLMNMTPVQERQALVNNYISKDKSYPIIEEDSIVYFIYKGIGDNVTFSGDANGWNASITPMVRIPGTDLWYFKQIYEKDARLDYKYIVNGNWILDPLNKFLVSGGYGPNSELRMPKYPDAPEIKYYNNIPHGTLWDTAFYSNNLGNVRNIKIYFPPDYNFTTQKYPVVLFHDGLEYISLANANNILDYLIANQFIQPVIGVFVPPVDRTEEYAGNKQPKFTDFILKELFPYIDTRFRTIQNPSKRLTLGASNGGNISLWLAYKHPEVFGNVAAYSSYIQSSLVYGFQVDSKIDIRLYMDLGIYDIQSLIPLVRGFVPILKSKGYDYKYIEYPEGHSWGNWRAHIDNALQMFFPGKALDIKKIQELPIENKLGQNFPNPFNPSTTITFYIKETGNVEIGIYNILGQKIDLLLNENLQSGVYSVDWKPKTITSGVYYYYLKTNNHTELKSMIYIK